MDMYQELREMAGLDLFGVASADAYDYEAPEGRRARDLVKGARSILVLGIRMLDLPLDGIPATRPEYTADFHMANTRLNEALFGLARSMQAAGLKAFPVSYKEMPGWNLENRPALGVKLLRHVLTVPKVAEKVEARMPDAISYRHAAVLAGLGELGVNNLLLTPEHGPRVRMVALVTDAELEPGTPLEPSLCRPEKCGYACVKACPAGALPADGSPTNKAACLAYYISLGIPGQGGVRCGLCMAKCPVYREKFRTSA